MSKFVRSFNQTREKFQKRLPGYLKRAAKNHPGTCILSKDALYVFDEFTRMKLIEAGFPHEKIVHHYLLKRGHILPEIEIKKEGAKPVHKPLPILSYENFINSLSLNDLYSVAERLAELGFK